MSLGTIYTIGKRLGDYSSLTGADFSVQKVMKRAESRMLGRMSGKATGMMGAWVGIWGLVMWAQGLDFIRHMVEQAAKRDAWLVTTSKYARSWEEGFTHNWTAKTYAPRPTLIPALAMHSAVSMGAAAMPTIKSSGKSKSAITSLRSGLYEGGKFYSSIQAIYKGNAVRRGAQVMAGSETTKFLWGTLRDPMKNVNEVNALQVRRLIRMYIVGQGLVDTGALYQSWQIGASKEEATRKSLAATSRLIDVAYSRWTGMPFSEDDWNRKYGSGHEKTFVRI